jgi:hypothetical protein
MSIAADPGFDARLGDAIGLADARILRPTAGWAREAVAGEEATFLEGPLQSMEPEGRSNAARPLPADDRAGEGVDYEGS